MSDVCSIFSWHEVCPVKVKVILLPVNEGAKEVEIVSSCVHTDKDDTIFCAEGEDSRHGEAIATEVGVLVHLSVVCAILFFAVEGVYE